MKKYYIYSLLKDGEVFYIGYTSDTKTRLYKHQTAFGSDVCMNVLEEYFGYRKGALQLELNWVAKYLSLGAKLVNGNKRDGELKITFTYACRPSVREMAMQKAASDGKTLSEIIDQMLESYVDGDFEIIKKTVVVFGTHKYELKP
jgi:predicted GIY-YIG superfamily endonuclease